MKHKRCLVTVGNREWSYDDYEAAAAQALLRAKSSTKMSRPAVIYDIERNIVMTVVTDDANGPKFHLIAGHNSV